MYDIKKAYKLVCLYKRERKKYLEMLDKQIKFLNELSVFMKNKDMELHAEILVRANKESLNFIKGVEYEVYNRLYLVDGSICFKLVYHDEFIKLDSCDIIIKPKYTLEDLYKKIGEFELID